MSKITKPKSFKSNQKIRSRFLTMKMSKYFSKLSKLLNNQNSKKFLKSSIIFLSDLIQYRKKLQFRY